MIWATVPSGAQMPFDPDPVQYIRAGNYRIDGDRAYPAEPMFDPPATQYYQAHWASCPMGDQFRQGDQGG